MKNLNSKRAKTTKLDIVDISKLKITKIRGNFLKTVYFNYDGEKYFVKDSSGDYGDRYTTLYKRISTNSKGAYKPEFISRCREWCAFDAERKRGETLRDVNVNDFIWNLTFKGLIGGMYASEVQSRKLIIDGLREELNNARDRYLRALWNLSRRTYSEDKNEE